MWITRRYKTQRPWNIPTSDIPVFFTSPNEWSSAHSHCCIELLPGLLFDQKKQMSSSRLSEIWWVKAKQLMCSKFWVILDVNPMWICMIPWSNGLPCKAWEVDPSNCCTSLGNRRVLSKCEDITEKVHHPTHTFKPNPTVIKSLGEWNRALRNHGQNPASVDRNFGFTESFIGFFVHPRWWRVLSIRISRIWTVRLEGISLPLLLAAGLGVSSLGILEKSFEGKISHELISGWLIHPSSVGKKKMSGLAGFHLIYHNSPRSTLGSSHLVSSASCS